MDSVPRGHPERAASRAIRLQRVGAVEHYIERQARATYRDSPHQTSSERLLVRLAGSLHHRPPRNATYAATPAAIAVRVRETATPPRNACCTRQAERAGKRTRPPATRRGRRRPGSPAPQARRTRAVVCGGDTCSGKVARAGKTLRL